MSAPAEDLAQRLEEATALHRQGVLDRAETLFQTVLREDPDNFEALQRMGAIRSAQARHLEAIDLLQRALACNAQSATAYYNLGIALTAEGRNGEAIESYRKAVALEPDFAEAHNNLGNALDAARLEESAIASYRQALAIQPRLIEANNNLIRMYMRLGRRHEVLEVYRKWLEVEPDDPQVQFRYALYSGDTSAPRMPDTFVENSFDHYAPEFDSHLHYLKYQGPELVADALRRVAGPPRGRLDILDAGCGTGLCSPFLRPYARRLTGVDLSSNMLEQARARNSYDALEKAELTAFLSSHPLAFDLIASADVLIYFGGLEPVLAAARAALRPRGLFMFTVERAYDYQAREGFRLNQSGRYSHTLDYLRRSLAAAGFGVLASEPAIIRTETRRPVRGLMVTAERMDHAGFGARARIRLRGWAMTLRRLLGRRRRG